MSPSKQPSHLHIVEDGDEISETDISERKKRRTCEMIAFRRTGLPEGSRIQALNDVLMHTSAEAEEINEVDLELLEEEFIRWRGEHPENKEAQSVDPKNRTELVRISREILRGV